jgi:dTDP-4-amino-4,6-dideoxygalactose transaminase
VGSGTDAITLSLLALGIGPGDEVITPAFNAAYAAQAVASIGAKNVFVDVNPDTLLMDAPLLNTGSNKTKAIIAVHLFGQMCNMPAISEAAQAYGLVLLEDAAQAHGARYNGAHPGEHSDVACYSHYPTKNLGAIGEAGSITTRLPFIDQQVRLLRDCGRTDRYIHTLVGRNSMLDEIQAAVLRVKLLKLHVQNAKRQVLADNYRKHLAGIGDLRFVQVAPDARSVNHLFPVMTERRAALMSWLKRRDIPSLSHYPCVMSRQPFMLSETLDAGAFPVAERAAREIMSLPLWPGMSECDQDKVIDAVVGFFE